MQDNEEPNWLWFEESKFDGRLMCGLEYSARRKSEWDEVAVIADSADDKVSTILHQLARLYRLKVGQRPGVELYELLGGRRVMDPTLGEVMEEYRETCLESGWDEEDVTYTVWIHVHFTPEDS